MKPIETKVLLSSIREHLRRTAITDFLELSGDGVADQAEFMRLHTLWLMARDEQRLVQEEYAALIPVDQLLALAP